MGVGDGNEYSSQRGDSQLIRVVSLEQVPALDVKGREDGATEQLSNSRGK